MFSTLGDEVCKSNEDPQKGYRCFKSTSREWGHHAPFFAVVDTESECDDEKKKHYSSEIPKGCTVDFVQVLSRHGARGPTESKGENYKAVAEKIRGKIKKNPMMNGKKLRLDSLRKYDYSMVDEELTEFGMKEMENSGRRFAQRYPDLSKNHEPFIRSTSKKRVMDSADQFSKGFQAARKSATKNQKELNISQTFDTEKTTSNPLFGGHCPEFYNTRRERMTTGVEPFFSTTLSKIGARLKKDIFDGLELTNLEVLDLMELCSFDTLKTAKIPYRKSAFCNLFTDEDWKDHGYIQSLMFYYTYGPGNTLGKNQGIGFVNELIARLTKKGVVDHTTVDHKIDKDPEKFPLDRALYADFTHDIAMVSIFAALGLFKDKLPQNERQEPSYLTGFSNSWVVPFAARAYFERMTCGKDGQGGKPSADDSLIRLVINERVVKLPLCTSDKNGACKQKDFIDNTLQWARDGGDWDLCKTPEKST